ncbi:MAG: hypothetical protein JNJ54_06810 [Myxococcaceae bacterium]|nr:hypothetical protein [Myxococcaceae bacterium]
MLLLALHLATASVHAAALPPSRPAPVVVLPDGGKKRKDGRDDEDAR